MTHEPVPSPAAFTQRGTGPPEVVVASAVVRLLATELSNYRHTVRSTAKRAIELMASAKGCTTTDILAPCRGALEAIIFSKQLRAVQVCFEALRSFPLIPFCFIRIFRKNLRFFF